MGIKMRLQEFVLLFLCFCCVPTNTDSNQTTPKDEDNQSILDNLYLFSTMGDGDHEDDTDIVLFGEDDDVIYMSFDEISTENGSAETDNLQISPHLIQKEDPKVPEKLKSKKTLHQAILEFENSDNRSLCHFLSDYIDIRYSIFFGFDFKEHVSVTNSNKTEIDWFVKCKIQKAKELKLKYFKDSLPHALSKDYEKTFNPCKTILSKTSMASYGPFVGFQTFLKLENCTEHRDLVFKCNDILMKYMEKVAVNGSDIEPRIDMKARFLHTVPWTCPGKIRGSAGYFVETARRTLAEHSLSNEENLSYLYCEPLLCNYNFYDSMYSSYILTETSPLNDKCFQYSNMNGSVGNIKLYEFEVPSGVSIVFLTGDYKNMSVDIVNTLYMMVYFTDPEIKRCCTDFLEDPIIFHNSLIYGFCYNSKDACHYQKFIGHKMQASNGRALIVMNKQYVNSKFFQLLAIFNFTQSFSEIFFHMNIQYKQHFYNPRSFEMMKYTFLIETDNKKNLTIITQELHKKGFSCLENEYFVACSESNLQLIFLHNCSMISAFDKSEIIFDESYSKNTSLFKALCQENMEVIKNEFYSKEVSVINYEEIPQSRFHDPSSTAYLFFLLNITRFPTQLLNFGGKVEIQEEFSSIYILNSTVTLSIGNNEFQEKRAFRSLKYTLMFLLSAKHNHKDQCLKDIYENRFSVQVDVTQDIRVLIGPIPGALRESPCLTVFPYHLHREVFVSFRKIITINKFWPTCFHNMMIITKENHDVILDWSYLSTRCQHQERALLFFSILITAGIYIGNIFVLLVLLKSGLVQNNPSFMIRFSLSLADLLVGIFPATFAVYSHIALITGRLTLEELDTEGLFTDFENLKSQQTRGFQQLRFERTDFYSVFSSIMMNISVNVSILSLCLLSIHNLMMVREKPLENRYVKIGIAIIWVLGISLSLLVNIRESGWEANGYFDPISKLTMNIGAGATSLSSFVFYIQVALLSFAGVLVMIFTIISLTKFRCLEYKRRHQVTNSQHERRAKVTWQMTRLLILMFLLIFASCIPPVLALVNDYATTHPVAHYFCWWLFIGGSSCNWIVYNLMGTKFRKEAKNISSCAIFSVCLGIIIYCWIFAELI